MTDVEAVVQRYYGDRPVIQRIDDALRAAGVDPERPSHRDLWPFDQLHSRGIVATREHAERAGIQTGMYVLDLGSGAELVGINTSNPNALAAEALAAGRIEELAGYASLRREVKYGKNSRVGFLLEVPARPPCYVEVKNVHLMRQPGLAEFPDAVTKRGAKHLGELADMAAAGARAVMLFLIQIGSAARFALARDIDPAYGAAFDRARAAGVEAVAYRCLIEHKAITLAGPVPIVG